MKRDKVMHAAGGVMVAFAVLPLVWVAAYWGIPWAMLAAAAAVGVAYEVQQRIRGEGQPDPVDALATASGGALPALLVWLLSSAGPPA